MLHDARCRRGKLLHRRQRAVGIEQVDVRQRLAMMLRRIRHRRLSRRLLLHVQCAFLMRILAITQLLLLFQPKTHLIRHLLRRHISESGRQQILCDRGVVTGGVIEGALRLAKPMFPAARTAMLAQVAQNLFVAIRRSDHQHVAMVLRRRTHHARPADVDVLDRLFEGHIRPGDRPLEGIEVDADQVDRLDAVLLHRPDVIRIVAQREQSAVDPGMQRLDPPVHHLSKPRHLGHVRHRQPAIAQESGGPPRADQLYAEFTVQRRGKLLEPRLVRN